MSAPTGSTSPPHEEIDTLLRELHRILGCSIECFGLATWLRVEQASEFRKELSTQFDLFEDMTLRYQVGEVFIPSTDVEKLDRVVFRQTPRPMVRIEFPVQINVNIPGQDCIQHRAWVNCFKDLKNKMDEVTNNKFDFDVVFCGEQVVAEDFKDWVTGLAGEEYIAEFGNPSAKDQYTTAGGTFAILPETPGWDDPESGGPANLARSWKSSPLPSRRSFKTNLFVEGLPAQWTANNLYELFTEFGTVTACRVLGKRFPGASVQSGLVDFQTHKQAMRAMENVNRMKNKPKSDLKLEIRFANNHRQQSYTPVFNRNLYVTNIPLTWTETDLKRLFRHYQGIVSTCVRMPGVGFVNFDSQQNAKAAMSGMQDCVPYGFSLPISISFARNGKESRTRKHCEFHQRGVCSFGSSCRNIHSDGDEEAGQKRTICKFYPVGCRFGSNCRNKHVDAYELGNAGSQEKSHRWVETPPRFQEWVKRDVDEAGLPNHIPLF